MSVWVQFGGRQAPLPRLALQSSGFGEITTSIALQIAASVELQPRSHCRINVVHLVGVIEEEFDESDVMLKVVLNTSTDAKNLLYAQCWDMRYLSHEQYSFRQCNLVLWRLFNSTVTHMHTHTHV